MSKGSIEVFRRKDGSVSVEVHGKKTDILLMGYVCMREIAKYVGKTMPELMDLYMKSYYKNKVEEVKNGLESND